MLASRSPRTTPARAGLRGRWRTRLLPLLCAALLPLGVLPAVAHAAATPFIAVLNGPVEQLTLNTPGDVWSGGWLRVGGQDVVLPRNLLIDLPAKRLSLQQLFATAPQACRDRGESGLAAADQCATGSAGFATVHANRTSAGDVIAGDLYLEKGRQTLTGAVTGIDVDQGYFVVGGNATNAGTVVRLNDPTGRQTVQTGSGCAPGAPGNCSPDLRFALDADNYTAAFSTGYPLCLPSTVARTFVDRFDLDRNGNTTEQLTAQAQQDGTGDLLCPNGNRTPDGVVADSRRLAPLQVGDSVTVKGAMETVGGVTFLSASSAKVGVALDTNGGADQPDYVVLDEMFIDAPAFQRLRIRDLFLGATTEVDSDVLLWSVHRDPATNAAHEFALGSVLGCENVAGPLTCRRVLGPHTFRVRHETLLGQGAAKTIKLSACDQLRADPRFVGMGTCPDGGTAAEEFGVLSPLPHEVVARTGRKTADRAHLLHTVDVHGAEAPNGQFVFPMGMGLGGIEVPNFAEIDINRLSTPISFDGIPWDLDRRLSPDGCVGPCEGTPQPLDPFPFSGFDPRLQGGIPDGPPYVAPHFTASALTHLADRVLSYVSPALGKPDGDATVLAWPPADPGPVGPAPPPPPPGTRGLIAGLTPSSGPQGATVLVDGVGLTGATAVSFNGGPAVTPTVLTDNQLSVVVPAGASSGVVSVTTPGGVLTSAVTFVVVPPPTVAGMTPNTGQGATPITVTGTGFTTATDVQVGGRASAFTVLSDTTLRTTVPMDAATGPVVVTSTGGSASSGGVFTVTAPPPPPAVSGFTPSNGSPGTVVTVTGSNLGSTTGVFFGGAASLSVVATPTQVTAVVPPGAFSGVVSVVAAGGGATSSASFLVTAAVAPPPPAVVTGLTPSHGVPGSSVVVSGTGLDFVTSVSFDGMPAAWSLDAQGRLTATVPLGATTGPVSVTTSTSGPGTGTVVFTVDATPAPTGPTISGLSPAAAQPGATVLLTGSGLAGATSVSVNGTAASSFTVLSPTSLQLVLGKGTTTGPVRVTVAGTIATSSTPLTVLVVPTITSFTPGKGNSGTRVVLTGRNLTGTTQVTVGGMPVRSFTVLSPTRISFVVGTGTRAGRVTVVTPGGTATSSARFTISGKAR